MMTAQHIDYLLLGYYDGKVTQMSLLNISSPSEAVNLLESCQTQERTIAITFENQTDASVVIWFAQLIDDSGEILPGYLADTGVFVGEANGSPHSSVTIDPCPLCGKFQPIQGNLFKSTVKIRFSDGEERDINLPDHHEPAGQYSTEITVSLTQQLLMEARPDFKQSKSKQKNSNK